MAATPSGDTELCVDYDNYSPRYSPTVIANVMNNVMNVRTRASAIKKSAYLLRYVKSTVPTLLYRVGYHSMAPDLKSRDLLREGCSLATVDARPRHARSETEDAGA
jgi:hypothetical protein